MEGNGQRARRSPATGCATPAGLAARRRAAPHSGSSSRAGPTRNWETSRFHCSRLPALLSCGQAHSQQRPSAPNELLLLDSCRRPNANPMTCSGYDGRPIGHQLFGVAAGRPGFKFNGWPGGDSAGRARAAAQRACQAAGGRRTGVRGAALGPAARQADMAGAGAATREGTAPD